MVSVFTKNHKVRKLLEWFYERTVKFFGYVSIIVLMLILFFLLKESWQFFQSVGLGEFLLGEKWHPISTPSKFGILPLIVGTFFVTITAMLISIPLGVGCAVYIAEIANNRVKEYLKILVELIAGIPSVVLGFLGLLILAPYARNLLNLNTGLTAFTGAVILAFMAIPTIATISEDAINSVPREYREAALALGATRWLAITQIIIPAAFSGILAAILLGIGRVIGETMVVMMVCGNASVIPKSIFQPVRTMTATIAAEMGETVRGSLHYEALFAIGLFLFIISFCINFLADIAIRRKGFKSR